MQCLMPYTYLLGIFKTILTVKTNLKFWRTDLNMVRAWLICEITYFFFTLASGMLFMFICALIPNAGTFTKCVEKMRTQGPWTSKDTNDFLRFVKVEYYLFTLQSSLLLTEISVGFSNIYEFKHFGHRDYSSQSIILLALIPHALKLIGYVAMMVKGQDATERRIRFGQFVIIIQLISFGAMVYFYFHYKRLVNQNLIVQTWVLFELFQSGIEPITYIFRLVILAYQKKEISDKVLNDSEITGSQDDDLIALFRQKVIDNDNGNAVNEPLLKQSNSVILSDSEFQGELSDKSHLTFMREDFIIMTALCYTKKNARHYAIVS